MANKEILFILGNGFSNGFNENNKSKEWSWKLICFRADVPWPETGASGFLSFQNCPNLLTLGARPYLDKDKALNIIEEVITCVNMFASTYRDKKIRYIYVLIMSCNIL